MQGSLRGWMAPGGSYDGYARARFDNMGPSRRQYFDDFFVYTVNVATLGPGISAQLNFQIQADSSFELVAINASAEVGANPATETMPWLVTLQLSDGGSGRNLFSQPVPLGLLCGMGEFTHVLPITRRFVSNSQVNVFLNNIDTAITFTNLQVNFIGRKIFNTTRGDMMGRRQDFTQFKSWKGSDGNLWAEDYYGYVFTAAALATTVNVPLIDIIESDADFEWILTEGLAQRNVTTGALINHANLTVQIQDGGAQRNLFSAPTNFGSIMGYGQLPFVLPQTRVFLSKTPVLVSITNIDNTSWNNIYVMMEGRKIFQVPY